MKHMALYTGECRAQNHLADDPRGVRRRRRCITQFFLKSIGATTDKLGNDWLTTGWGNQTDRTDLLDQVRFAKNKRPTGVHAGDKLVFYAAGWERFFGIANVLSDEPYEHNLPGEERWPWALDVETPLVVPRLDLAPFLSEIRVATTSVRQQSHIRLTEDQYRLALDALLRRLRP